MPPVLAWGSVPTAEDADTPAPEDGSAPRDPGAQIPATSAYNSVNWKALNRPWTSAGTTSFLVRA